MKKILTAIVLAAGFSSSVWAASQTVTLLVPGMTCSSCPITVKHALNKVEGVSEAQVSFATKQATVTFDDTLTDVEALTKATTDAGYPSELKE
ncbi:mercuric transport protein periplasmic component precursor [Pseudomonas sp. SCT]|mgnify:CR=1 FL=1|jgi:mercuric ion binding protein|uniref:mercury resistance system periplasmic binding protein MerP n=1 Tax=Gammaproteobacteria TaxID=1236 RepID=UPI000E00D868|nr:MULTISPECIES: mercury resistance system periplasmic binding protein MerP [Gammaproteobacteria]MBL1272240.1 mercury resistance system periplasmic binding protein MerP [Oceanospirillales bacterium]MDC8441261.1 mercury resistance system periplasmic binding protein MerP [Halomonas aquamarina]NKQ11255.1 mercury resistance system periplasmic binding protein MerP [Pseudomonas sp. SST3]QXP27882.1 mercury resistance system periplasmic binding protein MerP [Stutzerimonas stutzeri]UNG16626.1 mercury r|tara:strand:- start:4403 stop:4681 length:279 start_codon:yes stop_codon:yes gene_type:complete